MAIVVFEIFGLDSGFQLNMGTNVNIIPHYGENSAVTRNYKVF